MRNQVLLPSLIAVLLLGSGFLPQPLQAQETVAQSTPSIWRRFSSPQGGFSVLMPGQPEQKQQAQNTPMGVINTVSFSIEREGEAAYLVTYADFPAEFILKADPKRLFDGGRDEAIARVQGKLIKEESITLAGSPGRDIYIEAPRGLMIRNRVILVNQRMYQVIVVTPRSKEPYLTKSITGFLNSFQLLSSAQPASNPRSPQ